MSPDTAPTCDREELLNLLKSFIAFESVQDKPNEKMECLDWIATAFLSDHISSLQRGDYEGSPWLYLHNPECRILIFAHVDLVPGNPDQFDLHVDGDKAVGRGTSDMKGNILPFLMAFRDADKEGTSPPVSILITTDEEVAGNTISHLIDTGVITDTVAFTPDSNDIGIVCSHKGVCWSELKATGKGGHGAYPWDTVNPVFLLAEGLKAIQEAFPPGTHDDWQITASPTVLEGSKARNQVSDVATCGIDIRFPPEECSSADEALEKVRSVLPDGCELSEVLSASPLDTDQDHEMVKLYKQVASEVLGSEIGFKREHGGTDARYFSEKGIPAFLYGPTGEGLHSDNEWVSIESLQKHYSIYRELFSHLSSWPN